jgi:uncharacterized membrane protein YdjX (TVP38/TMEM64 family)
MPFPILGPRARLGLLVLTLTIAFVVFWFGDVLSEDRVRGWIDPFGPAGPLAYVAASALLGLALVPGALLAGVSGLLFGPILGTAVTLAASVASAVLSLLLARRVGAAGMAELSGARLEALADTLERHGVLAVIAQRLVPGLPDGPCNYAAGLLRIRPSQIALGTLIGSAPRAFSYAALGSTIGDPTSTLGLVAASVIVLTGLAGLIVARTGFVRSRNARVTPPSADDAADGA